MILDSRYAWVWIIAGGQLQVPYIQEAQRRRLKVLVTDRDPVCPGAIAADRFFALDTFDIPGHLQFARALQAPTLRGVLTAGADVGPTVSAVAAVLNLPAASLHIASLVQNKAAMRMHLFRTSSKVEHPNFLFADFGNEIGLTRSLWERRARALDFVPYPVVVKPVDNSATRGISIVYEPRQDAWNAAIAHALENNKNGRGVLLEERLSGDEVALDFFAVARTDGQAELIPVNGAYRFFRRRAGFGIELGHLNPWMPDEKIVAFCTDIARRLGVTWGPFKTDLIFDPRYGPCLLECATRLSGGYDHTYTAPLATGKDIVGAMLDLALGEPMDATKIDPKFSKAACAYAPIYAPGPIFGWAGLDAARSHRGYAHVFVREHEAIEPLDSCAKRPVFVIATGDTPFAAMRHAVAIGKIIHPIYLGEGT